MRFDLHYTKSYSEPVSSTLHSTSRATGQAATDMTLSLPAGAYGLCGTSRLTAGCSGRCYAPPLIRRYVRPP